MKTFFLYAGLLLGGAGLALAGLVAGAPRQLRVVSAVVVRAPRSLVYDQVRYFRQYPRWSPWRDTDPRQRFALRGPDGAVGARFSWVGVAEPGRGYQQIVALTPARRVAIACRIEQPFRSAPTVEYAFEAVPGGTRVTQRFETALPVPLNALAPLLGLRGNIRQVNERGLANLRRHCEQLAAARPLPVAPALAAAR
ncbi:SRPBCC family protein [Hymenobacter sp.]|uniref:SRPBCC family protein n=1 Tax=Hymenobacter sp. TaxID=1898978 RepID=UPI00286D4573|nr:SRPBCC family protein [Hymenobacter sp.]